MSAPLTPLGARTPHAHPAFSTVLTVLTAAAAIGIYLAAAYLQGWWPNTPQSSPSPTPSLVSGVEYTNEEYGVLVALPESWRGFTTSIQSVTAHGIASGSLDETFPEIHIVHPRSTAQKSRQDIPIMVFTHDQWGRIGREELSVGAAPIPPSELAFNSRFVFALPARYNYAFPEGWEEVQAILDGNPVFAFDSPQ